MEEDISYYTETLTDFQILSKNYGNIGDIVYKPEIKMWCLLPKNNFFYKPVILALILKKLNSLNGYKKSDGVKI